MVNMNIVNRSNKRYKEKNAKPSKKASKQTDNRQSKIAKNTLKY